jgi:hypothetical protein
LFAPEKVQASEFKCGHPRRRRKLRQLTNVVASAMKDTEDNNRISFDSVEELVRKPVGENAAKAAVI